MNKETVSNPLASGLKYLLAAFFTLLVGKGFLTTEMAQAMDGEILAAVAAVSALIASILIGVVQNFLAKRKSSGDSTGSGGSLVPLLCMMAVLSMALPSCNQFMEKLSEYPITGSIGYRDPETGAKGGLVFRPGEKPKASIKIPIYDGDGNLTGYADLEGPLSREVKVNAEK